jgi:CRP/FNR family transcriptional regulator
MAFVRRAFGDPARQRDALLNFFQRKTPKFRSVPAAALKELAKAASVRQYPRGRYLYQAGDPARELWVVLEGMVTINRHGLSGNKVSVEMFKLGDLFGLRALHAPQCACAVQAIRDSILAAIPKEIVLRQIDRHPGLLRSVTRTLFQRQTFLEAQTLLSREPAPMRLAAALLYLHHKFGPVLPVTHAEIGEVSGTTPETAMRLLKKLETRGILRKSRRRELAISDIAALNAELAGNMPDLWPLYRKDVEGAVPGFL